MSGRSRSFVARVHPELLEGLESFTDFTIPTTVDELPAFRAQLGAPPGRVGGGIMRTVPGIGDNPEVEVTLFSPADHAPRRPLVVWMHGGGLIAGTAAGDDAQCRWLSDELGAIVMSVEYRLAPEHPYPAAVDDCYGALLWASSNADELGVDPDRIAVGGGSAGGGLAAAVAIAARDAGGPALAFQYLRYPMLDDRGSSASSAEFADIPSWSGRNNAFAWSCVLGNSVGTDAVPPRAAPARLDDFRGLAPALIQVGDLDVFRDEDIDYARRLMIAGVPTELAVYSGAYHGFDGGAPDAVTTERMREGMLLGFRRAFASSGLGHESGPMATSGASELA